VRAKIDTYERLLSISVFYQFQQIEPALPAILGHRSEHSLATGPVIPEPFMVLFWGLTMTPALSANKNEELGRVAK